MRAVDTNILVRLITRDDVKQTELAESYISKGAWISHLVLAETIWVLDRVYELKPVDMVQVIDMLLHHETLSMQDTKTVVAALEHYRRRPTLGFSDCLVLEIAHKAGHVPLGTFDRNLSKLANTEKL